MKVHKKLQGGEEWYTPSARLSMLRGQIRLFSINFKFLLTFSTPGAYLVFIRKGFVVIVLVGFCKKKKVLLLFNFQCHIFWQALEIPSCIETPTLSVGSPVLLFHDSLGVYKELQEWDKQFGNSLPQVL